MDKKKRGIIGSIIFILIGIAISVFSFVEVKDHFTISLIILFFGIWFIVLSVNYFLGSRK